VLTWSRRLDRLRSRSYVARELALANVPWRARYRVLASDDSASRATLARWFRHTPHQLEFGDFEPARVTDYDLLLPLNVPDLRRLDGMRAHAAHSVLPIPSSEAIERCDDKLAFVQHLAAAGLGALVPALLDQPGPPGTSYLLKARRSHGGQGTWLITDPDADATMSAMVDVASGLLRQEYVPGRFEYATHALFMRNRMVRSLTLRYDMARDGAIKGREWPVQQRIVRCEHIAAFSAMLRALGFEGLCCIDYKMRDGRPLVMEVNPRIGNSLCPYFFSFLRDLPRRPTAVHAVAS
jgi:glutathione synthase/RimK-type ligase-like ATP-grasp enzyme